jgi:hypothetical protein
MTASLTEPKIGPWDRGFLGVDDLEEGLGVITPIDPR